jgi:hypothetical protein
MGEKVSQSKAAPISLKVKKNRTSTVPKRNPHTLDKAAIEAVAKEAEDGPVAAGVVITVAEAGIAIVVEAAAGTSRILHCRVSASITSHMQQSA